MLANTRRRSARNLSPKVDSLEGRQLLSSLTFQKIEMNSAGIVGQHIGMNAASLASDGSFKVMVPAGIQGNHIGMSAAVQGGHPGVGVLAPADLNPQPLPPGVAPKNWW